jgi:hypothetical protein
MRTQQEIIDRITVVREEDFFGDEISEYIRALTVESITLLRGTIIKEDADLSGFKPDLLSDKSVTEQCIDYMAFAWDKANSFRGLSASRSISHYIAWLWLLGVENLVNEDYEYYGKDELVKICQHFGLDSSKWDDGVRRNTEP